MDTPSSEEGSIASFHAGFWISELANNNSTVVNKIWISVSKSWIYLLEKTLCHNHMSYNARIAPEGNTIDLNVDLIVVTFHQHQSTKTDADVRRALLRNP